MPRTFYIIDGFAQIFRAFYAIRDGMRSPVTGEPTHAVFGFASMLFALLRQHPVDYVLVALDSPGKGFRDALYPAYKANRGPCPDELAVQIPRIFELIEGFGVAAVGVEGLEADDVIATVVQRVLDDPACVDLSVRILSRDKDLEQLLCDRVEMYDIHTGASVDCAALLANRGVTPEQVIDLLTLTGDSVDNVPGVPGIGPKTAALLLQQYGSIEGIYANLDQIKGKRRENLELSRETFPLSRRLVTLERAGDFPFALEDARPRPPVLERLLPLFQELGFRRFQEEIRLLAGAPEAEAPAPAAEAAPGVAPAEPAPVEAPSAAPAAERGEFAAVTTPAALAELAAALRAAPLFSVDTETTGLGRDARLCGLSFAWEAGRGVYVPVLSPEPESHLDTETVLAALRPVLEDPTRPKCGHNVKFDAAVLLRHGARLRGVVFDSMLASLLIDPAQAAHTLDHLATSLLGYSMIPISSLLGEPEAGKGKTARQRSMAEVPLAEVVPYAAEDADIALRLYDVLAPRLEALGLERLQREVEAPLAPVLAEMEANGILCDPVELRRQGEALGARVGELRAQVWSAAGGEFHLDSPKQLAEVLFDRLGLQAGKKTKTGRSTDIEELERLAAVENRADARTSVPRLMIEYRQLAKLISTYLGSLCDAVHPETRRIHSTFHQLVTATGRLASHGPNLQNIPVRTDVGRQVRRAFHAPEGHLLICADYSQVELRLLAHLSEDPALVEAFHRDEDIHAAVAAQVFGVPAAEVTREQRSHAKTINFGIIYGVTAFGLARRIEGLDVESAARLIADYKARFPGIERFLQECVAHASEHGYVCTVMGRRRAIPEIRASSRTVRALGERLAINSVVQGSAADLIKRAMVNVQHRIDRERLPLRLLLQIHDELVFEAPESEAAAQAELVREEMERALSLRVPLRAEAGIGADWMSAK